MSFLVLQDTDGLALDLAKVTTTLGSLVVKATPSLTSIASLCRATDDRWLFHH
ncbi:hypothetical protein J6590_005383 [Homalodisca vitripennis]|nr:hypothetical protein J6590_005383 [Homalodisca vitripennis]